MNVWFAPAFQTCFRHEKRYKPQLLGPDIFLWGGGLRYERVGAQKFGMSLNPGKQNFLGGNVGWDVLGAPEKFETKQFVLNFRPLIIRA